MNTSTDMSISTQAIVRSQLYIVLSAYRIYECTLMFLKEGRQA